MREHVEIHFDLSFPCDLCYAETKTRHGLRTHMYENHKKTKNLKDSDLKIIKDSDYFVQACKDL